MVAQHRRHIGASHDVSTLFASIEFVSSTASPEVVAIPPLKTLVRLERFPFFGPCLLFTGLSLAVFCSSTVLLGCETFAVEIWKAGASTLSMLWCCREGSSSSDVDVTPLPFGLRALLPWKRFFFSDALSMFDVDSEVEGCADVGRGAMTVSNIPLLGWNLRMRLLLDRSPRSPSAIFLEL